jgi:predicted methyltransferase
MTLADRVALIRPGVELRRPGAERPGAQRPGGTWADFGAGSGAFTQALASLVGPDAVIYALDRDERALRALEGALRALERAAEGRAPRIVCVRADFTQAAAMREADLPLLDGVLLANSLHFQADACQTLSLAAARLKPAGVLLVVEYDVNRANPWVPHPLPWSDLPRTAECAGLVEARLLGSRPSRYHGSMYAAACRKPGSGDKA